ncbi:MAG: SRPBCC domain-containing protein [Burkholderiaceae bacterium]
MSALPTPGDQASVTIGLAVSPLEAFEAFTQDIGLWWRRGPRFRNARGEQGIVCLEPGVGGRVFESFDGPAGEVVIEMGRTEVWDPPHRLLFAWRFSNFAPGESTEVEVLFQPSANGCRVTVMHRGWSQVRADHPARHGLPSAEFIRMIGLWWADLLRPLAERSKR